VKRAAIISVLLSVGSLQAQAALYDRCLATNAKDWGESDHRDHGQGVVSFKEWGSFSGVGPILSSERLVITSCRTKEHIEVWSYRDLDPFDPDLALGPNFDNRVEVAAKFEALLSSQETYSLIAVAREMSLIGETRGPSIRSEQPCACAVSYPSAGKWEGRFRAAD